MSDGQLDCGARRGTFYHSPVAACTVTHIGNAYGFQLTENTTHWMHHDSCIESMDKCLAINLRDIFHGTTKYAEIKSEVIDGAVRRYFVRIDRGCKSDTKLIFPADDRELSAAAIFTIYDEFDDDAGVSVFRHGADVYMRFPINVRMALCGFKLVVNAIDGRVLKLLISDVVSPDYVKVIPNEGLPNRENPLTKGKLHLCFKIEFPKTLSKQCKADIAELLDRAHQ